MEWENTWPTWNGTNLLNIALVELIVLVLLGTLKRAFPFNIHPPSPVDEVL